MTIKVNIKNHRKEMFASNGDLLETSISQDEYRQKAQNQEITNKAIETISNDE